MLDPLTNRSIGEMFLQHFLEFLKRILQNFYKMSKNYFIDTIIQISSTLSFKVHRHYHSKLEIGKVCCISQPFREVVLDDKFNTLFMIHITTISRRENISSSKSEDFASELL